jgi:SAM-dependent methyltransferase
VLLLKGRNVEEKRQEIWTVVKCANCGLVYLNPRPTGAEIVGYYNEQYKPFQENAGLLGLIEDIAVKVRTRKLKKIVKEGGRILEIGCGIGQYLASVRDTGLWEVAGVELSPHAAAFAREKRSLAVSTGTIFDADFPAESFDAVIMRHVLEHVPSPTETLREIRRVLRRGGKLILTVPNVEAIEVKIFKLSWCAWSFPYHSYHFSAETLSVLLKKTGFVVENLHYSAVPNNWARSVRIFLNLRKAPLLRFSNNNLVFVIMLLAFTPISFLASKFKKSGRIDMVAMPQ